jgi:hypothetical protein
MQGQRASESLEALIKENVGNTGNSGEKRRGKGKRKQGETEVAKGAIGEGEEGNEVVEGEEEVVDLKKLKERRLIKANYLFNTVSRQKLEEIEMEQLKRIPHACRYRP